VGTYQCLLAFSFVFSVDDSVPQLLRGLPWLMPTVFAIAICSFPLVTN